MKEFRCSKCGIYLGEMTQGKMKKGTIVLCIECHEAYKVIEALNSYRDNTKGSSDMPEFFKDIFKGVK